MRCQQIGLLLIQSCYFFYLAHQIRSKATCQWRQRTGNQNRSISLLACLVRQIAGQQIKFFKAMFQVFLGQVAPNDAIGVGGNNICAGGDEIRMNLFDRLGCGYKAIG